MRTYSSNVNVFICRLNYTSEEGKHCAYLNPNLINQLSLNPTFQENSEEFKGMTVKEKKKAKTRAIKNARPVVETYIGHTMLAHQDKDVIMAPYNFK